MTARVFVPLVDSRGEAAHLFEAIAGDSAPEEHPAHLVPQIAELFDFGLYGVGQSAREAVTSFLEARRRRLWLSPRNARLTPWSLRISDLQLGRLSDGNARSAGLGLTIAALCQAFGRDPGLVFASGEILPGRAGAGVGPVSGVRGKLALIGDYLSQHGPALEGQRVVVALPAQADDGRPLAEAEQPMLARLAEEAEQSDIRLEIVFAATLDALEAPLGPFTIPERVTPARAAVAAAAAGVVALALGGWSALAHAPIRLAFEPPAAGGAASVDEATPQRARYDAKSDKLVLLGPCFDAQREPLVVGGETLVLKVRAEDGLPFASRVRPMRLFIASVSRNADPVILDAAHFRSLQSGQNQNPNDLVAAIPIEPVEDEVRLFVLATRDPHLAISGVEAALRATLKGLSGASALAATTTFLADRLGAEIAYQFRVTNDSHACAA
ncbi:MAG TPA: hypothetical protein VN715_17640 [Roseiarcus sp.]|nr:hypothetical protein [Roseiarcus sp.]